MPLPGLNLDAAAAPLLVFRLTKQLAGEKYGIAWSMSGRGGRDLQVWRVRPKRVKYRVAPMNNAQLPNGRSTETKKSEWAKLPPHERKKKKKHLQYHPLQNDINRNHG